MTSDLYGNIQELEREIAERRALYPEMVAAGRLTERQADHQLNSLRVLLAFTKQEDAMLELRLAVKP